LSDPSSDYLRVLRVSSTALSLFSIAVSRSSISLRIRTLSSFLGTYWPEGLRGDGIGSMGVGCNGSNGRLGSIYAGRLSNRAVLTLSLKGMSISGGGLTRKMAQPKYLRTILTPTSLAAHFSPLNLTAPSRSRLARCSPSFSAGNPFSLCPG